MVPKVPIAKKTGRAVRKWWPKFLAIVGDRGNVSLACKLAGVSRRTLYQARAKHPKFNQQCEAALSRYAARVACGEIVPGRAAGRPCADSARIELAKNTFLAILAETGSGAAAAPLAGCSLNTFRNWRRVDSEFSKAWDAARTRGDSIVEIAGHWQSRESHFNSALREYGGDVARAAFVAGVSPYLAGLIVSRSLAQTEAAKLANYKDESGRVVLPANRFRGDKRLQQVTAAPEIRAEAIAAILANNEREAAELEAARKLVTPEMQLILDHVTENGVGVYDAARLCGGFTPKQVDAWRESNVYFRTLTDSD